VIVADAIDDLEKSVEKKPVSHAYLVALATAHGMLEHYDRASRLLSTALRIRADDSLTLGLKAKADTRQDFWPARP